MATKTFKIGEYCKGGIITVETKKSTVHIIAKDWDYSQGTRKNSNQKNAKEFDRCTVDVNNDSSSREMSDFLHDLTTSYYADQVMQWIDSKVEKPKGFSAMHW